MDLPRSTQTGRGQLAGPALSARQVRRITVHIEQVAPGVLHVSAPFGWPGGLARTPQQLASLVASGFTEAQVAAYAKWIGDKYDDGSGGPIARPSRPRRARPHRIRNDIHDPRKWRVDGATGKWISPSGKRWRPDSANVQRVQAKLARMMLPPKTIEE